MVLWCSRKESIPRASEPINAMTAPAIDALVPVVAGAAQSATRAI